MADYDKHPGTSSSSGHDYNIPILLGIENYSIWATRMRSSLGGFQALALIGADPPRVANGNFSAANVKLMGQALSLMTNKMGDAAIDLATGANMVKELWSRLLTQYHERRWGVKLNFFQKLVHLRHSDCESIGDYIGKL